MRLPSSPLPDLAEARGSPGRAVSSRGGRPLGSRDRSRFLESVGLDPRRKSLGERIGNARGECSHLEAPSEPRLLVLEARMAPRCRGSVRAGGREEDPRPFLALLRAVLSDTP